jgi:hypothetical protein
MRGNGSRPEEESFAEAPVAVRERLNGGGHARNLIQNFWQSGEPIDAASPSYEGSPASARPRIMFDPENLYRRKQRPQ